MKNDKLILCLFGSLMLSAVCRILYLAQMMMESRLLKWPHMQNVLDEIETNPTWIMGSKLLSEDQKQKKKREVCNCVGDNSPKVLSKEQLALAAIDPKAKATSWHFSRNKNNSHMRLRNAKLSRINC